MLLISHRFIKTDIPCQCRCDRLINIGTYGQTHGLGGTFPDCGKDAEEGRLFSVLVTHKTRGIITSNITSKELLI